MLLVMGVALTASPVVYKTMERIEFAKVGAVLVFLVVALVAAHQRLRRTTTCRRPPPTPAGRRASTSPLMLGALAFAGVGGVNNLCQSNWIRDKGFGMGAHIPHVVSPITGEDQAKPSTGYMVRQDEENLDRFWGWWRWPRRSSSTSSSSPAWSTIMVFSLLAYSTVYGQDLGEDLDFIQGEGHVLRDVVGPWFGTLFWVIGAVSLFAGCSGSSTTSPA